jgi:hypothetical protein
MTRRLRNDGPTGRVQGFTEAMMKIAPPQGAYLRPEDRPFWDAIVAARSPVEWSTVDLMLAANLARTQADIERLAADLAGQADVVDGKPHPVHTLIDVLTRREVAVAKVLQLHARARLGEARDVAKRREGYRAAADALSGFGDDDLIPSR